MTNHVLIENNKKYAKAHPVNALLRGAYGYVTFIMTGKYYHYLTHC